jgi:hypothetical protein
MRQGPVKMICRWCGDARVPGNACSRDDELRSSCNCGTRADFPSTNPAADFDELAAVSREFKAGRVGKRH